MFTTLAAAEAPLRVLIVDDCRDNADTMVILLLQWGYNARSVYDVASAVALARTFAPDVVITDIAMPGSTGLELASVLRALQPGPHSIIALSGYADDDRRQAAEQAGFDYYLVKPPDLHELHGLLEGASRVAGRCRRIATLADRTELLATQARGLIDEIRGELRTLQA